MTKSTYAKTLRKFLAITSILALVNGSASTTLAGTLAVATGGNEALSAPGTWVGAAPADHDSILLGADGHNLDFDRLTAIIAGIDFGGHNNGTLTITNSTSIGSMGHGTARNIVIPVGQTVTLTGTQTVGGVVAANTYTALGNITLGDAAAKLIIDANITLAGTINGTGSAGQVEINANKNAVFASAIGIGNQLTQLKLGANATLDLQGAAQFNNAGATAIELGAGSILTISGGRALSSIHLDEEINGAGLNEGTLIFTGGDSSLSGLLIGGTNPIHELRIASTHKLTTDSSIKATQINFAADGTLITEDSITGKIDNTSGGNSVGTLNLISDVGDDIDGNIGETHSLKALNVGKLANNDKDVIKTLKGTVIKADTITISANSIAGGNKSATLVLDSTAGAQTVTGAIDSTAVANGGTSALNFIGGGATVTGKLGNTHALTAVNVGKLVNNDKNVKTTLQGSVIKVDKITISANSVAGGNKTSTLVLDSTGGVQVLTGAIDSTAAANGGKSILNFIGANGTMVTDKIGNTNALTGILIGKQANNDANASATLQGSIIKIGKIILSSDSTAGGGNHSSTLVLDSTNGAQTLTGAIDSTAVANGGTSVLNFVGGNGTTVTGETGNTNALTAINVKSGATAILPNAVVKATVINIGEAGVAGAATLARGGAVNFRINDGVNTTVVFGHADSQLELSNTDAGANHSVTLYGNLTGAGDNEGKLRLSSNGAGKSLVIAKNGAVTIGISDVNRMKELIIDGTAATRIVPKTFAKKVSLGGTGDVVFVNGLDLGAGGAINVNQNIKLQGNIDNTGGGVTINLDRSTLTYNKGTATFSGAVTIDTTINPGVGIGNIVVDATGGATTLDLSTATGIAVNINGTSNVADIGQSYQLITLANGGTIVPPAGGVATVLTNNDAAAPKPAWAYNAATGAMSNPAAPIPIPVVPVPGGAAAAVVVVPGAAAGNANQNADINLKITKLNDNNSNAYVNYVLANGRIAALSNVKEGIKKDFGKTNADIVEAFANIDIKEDSDARDVVNELGILSTTDPVRQQDAANRLSVAVPTKAVTSVYSEIIQAMQGLIGGRMENLSMGSSINAIRVSESSGVAAGSELGAERYGAWGSPFYMQSTQKTKDGTPGYKVKSAGGTIGFDYLANDSLTLGVAFTAINTKIDHKDKKVGDNTKVDSMLYSLYGSQQISGDWFVQGIFSYGSNKVRNKEKRIINLTLDETAVGKFKSNSYTGEVLGGYKIALPDNQTTLTPMAGVRYTKLSNKGYTETGTNRRNLSVSKSSITKVEGVIGGRVSLASQLNDGLLMPEAHGFVNYDFKGKAPKVEARLQGALAPMPSKSTKPEKLSVNLGASLTTKYQMMEYGIGYDANLAKKYVSHQGSLKVRVNF